jgi:hypothetical protein
MLFGLEKPRDQRWMKLQKALPKLVKEIRGFDRGFSIAGHYFARKEGKTIRIEPEGLSIHGQSSNKEWLQSQWSRIRPIFYQASFNTEESRALGGSPITANWIYGVLERPDGKPIDRTLGAIALARRGKIASFFTGLFYTWSPQSREKRLLRVLDTGEKALSVGLGALKSDRKGARIPGLEVFQPKGTTLGRVVFNLAPYFDQLSKSWGKALEESKALGFLSTQSLQGRAWVEDGIINEKIQILETKNMPSAFEAVSPLESNASRILSILPKKAFGFLRFKLNLDWFRKLFQRTQKLRGLRLTKGELSLLLNTIRSLNALPIPKDPTSLDDFIGTQSLTLFFSPPSPGSYWPEIFVVTPKREKRTSPRERLETLSKPFYKMLIGNKSDDKTLNKKIKIKGKGARSLAYLNYGKVIVENQKSGWFRVSTGLLPGGGSFCAAETDHYSILCFTPSAMKRFLRSKKTENMPSWLPEEALGKKGDLLQGCFRLQNFSKTYPLRMALAIIGRNSPKSKNKPHIPTSTEIAQLFSTESFRLYRLPSKEKKKSVIVFDHKGSGLFSLINISSISFGGILLDYLFYSFSRN